MRNGLTTTLTTACLAMAFCFVLAMPQARGQVLALPYVEAFDAGSALPPGWTSTRVRHPLEDDAAVSTSIPRSSPNCVLITNATIAQALTSPVLLIPPGSGLELSFYTRRSGSFGAAVAVEVSTDSGRAFRTMATLIPTGSTSYLVTTVSMESITGSAVFRWRVQPDSAGSTGTFRLDDVTFSPGVPVQRNSVVINEIMYAPFGDEPEWVEILNPGISPITLSGWSITDAGVSTKHPLARALVLPPGSLAVLCRDSAALAGSRPSASSPILTVSGFPSLNNSGDVVVLFDGKGQVIDSVVYLQAWSTRSGASLERIDPLGESATRENWGSSVDPAGATPGLPNSNRKLDHDLSAGMFTAEGDAGRQRLLTKLTVRNHGRQAAEMWHVTLVDRRNGGGPVTLAEIPGPGSVPPGDSVNVVWEWAQPPAGASTITGEVVWELDERTSNNSLEVTVWIPFPRGPINVSEIMAAPLSGDPEFVEVASISNTPVDLRDWTANGRALAVCDTPVVVQPGGFAVLAADSGIYRRFPWLLTAGVHVRITGSSLSLNNDADTVVLRDPRGLAADSVRYEDSWHNPLVSDHSGRSLEKIVLAGQGFDRKNWSTCLTTAGGTPGAPNSVRLTGTPGSGMFSASPNPFSPDADGHEDFAAFHFEVPDGVFAVSLTIFDVRGRMIRHLASGQPVARTGEIVWDGLDERGRALPIGQYVAVLEGSGGIFSAKCVVVLARWL